MSLTDSDGVTYTTNPDGSITVGINRLKKFFPHPNEITISVGEGENKRLESFSPYPRLPVNVPVQDVGENQQLQNDVTHFYHQKIVKWIKKYPEFSHLKKYKNFLESNKGHEYMFNLLKLFVKKSAANWYDLRDPHNYPIVKDYLRFKIGAI